jgi:hypothetical protein
MPMFGVARKVGPEAVGVIASQILQQREQCPDVIFVPEGAFSITMYTEL